MNLHKRSRKVGLLAVMSLIVSNQTAMLAATPLTAVSDVKSFVPANIGQTISTAATTGVLQPATGASFTAAPVRSFTAPVSSVAVPFSSFTAPVQSVGQMVNAAQVVPTNMATAAVSQFATLGSVAMVSGATSNGMTGQPWANITALQGLNIANNATAVALGAGLQATTTIAGASSGRTLSQWIDVSNQMQVTGITTGLVPGSAHFGSGSIPQNGTASDVLYHSANGELTVYGAGSAVIGGVRVVSHSTFAQLGDDVIINTGTGSLTIWDDNGTSIVVDPLSAYVPKATPSIVRVSVPSLWLEFATELEANVPAVSHQMRKTAAAQMAVSGLAPNSTNINVIIGLQNQQLAQQNTTAPTGKDKDGQTDGVVASGIITLSGDVIIGGNTYSTWDANNFGFASVGSGSASTVGGSGIFAASGDLILSSDIYSGLPGSPVGSTNSFFNSDVATGLGAGVQAVSGGAQAIQNLPTIGSSLFYPSLQYGANGSVVQVPGVAAANNNPLGLQITSGGNIMATGSGGGGGALSGVGGIPLGGAGGNFGSITANGLGGNGGTGGTIAIIVEVDPRLVPAPLGPSFFGITSPNQTTITANGLATTTVILTEEESRRRQELESRYEKARLTQKKILENISNNRPKYEGVTLAELKEMASLPYWANDEELKKEINSRPIIGTSTLQGASGTVQVR